MRTSITILFTDLVDSTKLSGQLDAEDYREIVRAYQAACAKVIERFECNLAQTLGDGLLIYSGYPVAHENDAERAVRVGLGILENMKSLNERLEQDRGIRLAVRVGIHTGTVVVGDVGAGSRPEQLALGEVPNVAARIQGLAEPDTIVISDATYRLIQGYFDCQTLGEQTLRGVAETVVVHRVLHESGAQSRLDIASTHGLTPLVGRESEVTLLRDRWNQAKAGMGQVILLNAEPGLGKSRMIQALREHLVDETYTRLECRSSPYYQNTALYPVIDLVQRTLQWHQDDSSNEKLGKLEQALSQYRLSTEETIPLMAGLLSLVLPEDRYPSLNLTPQRQRQKTLETIVAMILELAERQPVLFIVEDLHWTDPSTLELLGLLVDQTPTTSVYVLLTCRPEFQSQWRNKSYFTQVTLNRLSRDGIEQISTKVAGGKTLPDEVLQQLVEKTDGVPLYVEEMTKAVLESGVLKDIDGQYELTGPLSSLSIPSTLQDSLMARLDRLVTAKAVAQYAAVIGRQFSYGLLQAVSQLDEAMLQHELGRLVEAELIYQRGLPPQATYTFKHALIQDTAYESLLRRTRQRYHRRIAEVLVERFPDIAETQPELLAHHFTEAGLNEQAVGYWQRAGQSSMERSAYVEASFHLTRALELLMTRPETRERSQHELELRVEFGPVLMVTRGYASLELRDNYARARELCQQLMDAPKLFQVLKGLRRYYTNRGELHLAMEICWELLRCAEDMQETSYRDEAHLVVGVNAFWLGEFPDAYTHIETAATFRRSVQHQWQLSRDPASLASLAWVLMWALGYPDQALHKGYESLRYATELSHPYMLAHGRFWTALLHQLRGEWCAMQELAESCVTLAKEQGFATYRAYATMECGAAHAALGHSDEGIVQLKQGLAAARDTGGLLNRTYFLALLTETYQKTGQIEQGLATLTEAQDIMDKTGERPYEAELYRLKGTLLLQLDGNHLAQAESSFRQALDVARRQHAKSWELRASTSLAKLWQSQGKCQEAYDLLAPVYGWFTEGFDTADLIDAKALLDELTEGQP